jgi:hypothetical protein
MAKVIYEIEMNAENAPMIDQVNRLLLGNGHTAEAGVAVKGDAKPAATKPAATKPAATKPAAKPAAKVEKDTGGDSDDEMSLADFKAAVKKAKAEHGEEFCKQTLEANGAKKNDPLGRMVSAIDADDYADLVAAFVEGPTEQAEEAVEGPTEQAEEAEEGPTEQAEEAEEDDFDDEEEDSSEVTADAVKVAAKAYAKEVGRDEAKEIMNSNGAATLTKIADCTAKQLQAMFKAFTA